jgi:hypothetical protein
MMGLQEKFKIIKEDEDLVYFDSGIAVQKDRGSSVEYNESYFEKYVSYEGTPISILLNKSRVSITERFCKKTILDIGIGSGDFIKSSKKLKVYGFDINPCGVKWLKDRNLFLDPYQGIPQEVEGLTFWDSLEHFPEPQDILKLIHPGQYVFVSIPIFHDVLKVKEWKHYRPNEHYYYFTFRGIINYMTDSGFELLDHHDEEIEAGRQDILTFVFRRLS